LADIGMLEQVLLNLAVNARDAMPGGGKITLRTAVQEVTTASARAHPDAYPGRFAQLTVTDTGAGIAPDVLARIFEPFFTTKDLGHGTGLGLATVHGIVQQHRGWLTVKSQLGVGTTFDIFLPATDERPLKTIPPPRAVERAGSGTILVVEDEPALRQMVSRVLGRRGYRVLLAGSAIEAMAVWAEHADSIDLLFTDLMLPDGQSGRLLAEKLAASRPSLKIIYTSGYSSDFVSEDFVLEEGVNFLQKPYELAHLRETIQRGFDIGVTLQ
jgi:CheY-like chemotaxis protein